MLSTSACIIPLGPDFQDPVAGPNYPPYFESANPDFGSIVTPPATPPLTFAVTVTDPNVGDDLYIEWQADYPGVNHRPLEGMPSFVGHSLNGTPLHQTVTANVDCIVDNLTPTPNGEHQIEVIVADRPFLEPVPPHLDLVEKPGFAIHASWFVEQLTCPSSPTP